MLVEEIVPLYLVQGGVQLGARVPGPALFGHQIRVAHVGRVLVVEVGEGGHARARRIGRVAALQEHVVGELGDADPMCDKMRSVMAVYERAFASLSVFIQKGEMIEGFNSRD